MKETDKNNCCISELANIDIFDSSSNLAEKCNRAISKKVKDLNVSDMRLLISQNIALEIVVPIALSLLERDPLVGNLYRGELLLSILECGLNNLSSSSIEKLIEIRIEIEELSNTIDNEILPILKKFHY